MASGDDSVIAAPLLHDINFPILAGYQRKADKHDTSGHCWPKKQSGTEDKHLHARHPNTLLKGEKVMKISVHLFLFVLALVFFLLAGLGLPEPNRVRFLGWGLFCWALSSAVTI